MSSQGASDHEFEDLLDYLRVSRGFDFTGYKRSSLMRRVNKRRYILSMRSFGEYLDYLQVHPDEFEHLFNTILINVTSFFRDKGAWEHLRTDIIPRILEKKNNHDPVRVWSAGCASGEEAYSVAMLIAEQLGIEAFQERVKIYATDMDKQALYQARQAIYSSNDLSDVPDELREKYLTPATNSDFQFNTELRRAVIFGEHDLVQDAPISRLDLLVCRNTLMYFNSEAQTRILSRFHFALNDGGVLFLGKAEMLLSHANIFAALDMKYRFFTKVSRPDVRNHLLALGPSNVEQLSSRLIRLRDLAFEASPDAQLIVDTNGVLLSANNQAKKMFSISSKDIGETLDEMEVYFQPVGLRPLIKQVIANSQPTMVAAIEMRNDKGKPYYIDGYITPLQDNGNRLAGIIITFIDISHNMQLQEQLKRSSAELETTNEELQSTVEELETTNEELQSTVEELETTNEELQSTVEELETMNEELQSTNEELETINDELSQRTNELNDSKGFLETILGNLRVGVAVVDREFRLLNWNRQAEELWGLRPSEIMGLSLLGLDIGLPVEKLKNQIRSILDEKSEIQEVTLEAFNRRGRSLKCRVTCTPFKGGGNQPQGVVVMMEEEEVGK